MCDAGRVLSPKEMLAHAVLVEVLVEVWRGGVVCVRKELSGGSSRAYAQWQRAGAAGDDGRAAGGVV